MSAAEYAAAVSGGRLGVVGVAQLVERRLVVADVAGSSPVTHPHVRRPVPPRGDRPTVVCQPAGEGDAEHLAVPGLLRQDRIFPSSPVSTPSTPTVA